MEVRERGQTRDADILNNNNNEEKSANLEKPAKERKMVFKEKEFRIRESLLTTLCRETETRVVYNFVCGAFFLLLVRALVDDVITHGIPFHHTWLIWWNFAHFPATMAVWGLMFLSTFIPFAVMKVWAHTPAKEITKAEKIALAAGHLLYLCCFFFYPLRFLFNWQLNCACSFIITCESTRIAMKLHSFIRENYSRAVEKKLKAQSAEPGECNGWPTVSQFVYFQFCPSFIYRDEYPRNPTRSWSKVAYHFSHCLAAIEFVNLAFTQYVFPWFSVLKYSEVSTSTTVLSLFSAVFPGFICYICLFYGLLHSWLNTFSELMRFGDREFYSNWWNSDNMAVYYRNWNLVVHDWLYAYIYRDVAVLLGGRRGLKIAQTAVFFISAVFHEYWFGVALRVFYPVMFMLYFVFGGVFFSVSRYIKYKSAWNTALWFNLLIGTGMFISFYGQEWYARSFCRPRDSPILDALLPRHWDCRTIQ